MAKLTTADLASLANQTAAITTINNNFAAVEAAMEKTLSRDGTTPNSMGADIDMNSNRLINLPDPVTSNEAVTKGWAEERFGGAEVVVDLTFQHDDPDSLEYSIVDKMKKTIYLEEFGVISGIDVTDGIASSNVLAATKAFDFAEENGKNIQLDAGTYVFAGNGLRIPSGVQIYGHGYGYWDPVYPQNDKTWTGTNLIFKGATGAADKYTITGVTSMKHAGGRREDPDNPGEFFSLTSWMNADATGTTPATPKQLSVAITGRPNAFNWGIHGVRVVPWRGTDGITDYSNESSTTLSHPWDVGVLVHDSEGVDITNCQIVGDWRLCGVALMTPGFTDFGRGERNLITHSRIQGHTGLVIRGADQYALNPDSAAPNTSSTVTIRWSEENFWPTSGFFLGVPGNATYTYTGTTRVGDYLRFDGVTPNPTTAGLFQIRSHKTGSGVAGTQIENTIITGLDHVSGNDAEAMGLGISKVMEISGAAIRGLQFKNLKTATPTERVNTFLHDVSDLLTEGWQVEGSQSHIIASPATTLSTASSPVGDSRNIRVLNGIGFVDVKNALWTPRNQFRDVDQISPRDELENNFILRALPGQDVAVELAAGKDFIVRNSAETALLTVDEATGAVALPGALTLGDVTTTGDLVVGDDATVTGDLVVNQTSTLTGNITASGSLTLTGAFVGSNSIRAAGGSPIFWSGRSALYSPADGQITARNFADSSFSTVSVATPTAAEHAATKAYVDRGRYVIDVTGSPVTHTGNTSETILRTIAVPAASLGNNGVVQVTTIWTVTNNANVKTPRVRFGGTGGTAFMSGSLTTSLTTRNQIEVFNRNSTSSQVAFTTSPALSFGSTANGVMTGSVDTASAFDIVLTGQLANAADSITLEACIVEILYKA